MVDGQDVTKSARAEHEMSDRTDSRQACDVFLTTGLRESGCGLRAGSDAKTL